MAPEGQTSRHQLSDVCRGAHSSPGVVVIGTGMKEVAPAWCRLSVFPRVPRSLNSAAGSRLTMPYCVSTAAVEFAR